MDEPTPILFDPTDAVIGIARDLVTRAEQPMMVLTRDASVIATNNAAALVLDQPAISLIGGDVVSLLDSGTQSDVRSTLATAIATGTPRIVTTSVTGAQQQTSHMQWMVAPVAAAAGSVAALLVSLFPTSKLPVGGTQAARLLRSQRAIADLGRGALERRSLRAIEHRAVALATHALAADAVGIFRLARDTCQMRRAPDTPIEWWSTPAELRTGTSLLPTVVRSGQSILVNSLEHDERFSSTSWLEPYRSAIVTLVRSYGRIVGGIVIASFAANAFTSDDLTTAELMCDVIGAAAERTQAARREAARGKQIALAFEPQEIGTWAWDLATERVWWSPETEAMFGLVPGTFGGTVDTINHIVDATSPVNVPEPDRAAFLAEHHAIEMRFTDPLGVTRWIELRGRALDPDEPAGMWVGVAYDATERSQMQSQRRFAEEQARLARDAAAIANTEARRADAQLRHLIATAPAGFGIWDREFRCTTINDQLASVSGLTPSECIGRTVEEYSPARWQLIGDAYRRVLETGTPITGLEVTAVMPVGLGRLRTWMANVFPTMVDGDVTGIGAVVVEISEQKRAERVERLLRKTSDLFAESTLDLDNRFRRVAELPINDFADFAVIIASAGGDELVHVAVAPSADGHIPNPTNVADALRNNPDGITAIRELTQHPDRHRLLESVEELAPLRAFAMRSAIAAPLTMGGAHVGTIVFGYTDISHRRYEARDVAVVQELAYRCSDALDAQALRRAARAAQARVELLAKIGELVPSGVLGRRDIGAVTAPLVPDFADIALVAMKTNDGFERIAVHAMDPAAERWMNQRHIAQLTPFVSPPTVQAITTGRVVTYTGDEARANPSAYPAEVLEFIEATGVTDALVVPLIGTHGPIGSLICAHSTSQRTFSAEDIALAPEIARRIAPVIETLRSLERSREHTAALQQSLLPRALPNVFGYRLAAQYRAAETELTVGGDWYDALELPDRSLLLVIGDVVGHGALAAGLTGQLRTALRIAVLDTSDVTVLLERLDRFLAGLDGFEVATAALAVLDHDTGDLTWSSAGHPPPLIRRANGTAEYLTTHVGPPLGAIVNPLYQRSTTTLHPEDCLIMYTDGLIERRDESIDVGLARLAAIAESRTPDPDDLNGCALEFMNLALNGTVPRDDIALLIAHREAGTDDFSYRIENRPDAIRSARTALATFLHDHDIAAREIDDLLLIASELCANAMEHAGTATDEFVLVRCTTANDGIELSVEDTGAWSTSGPRHGGRGLQIVRALADSVDITRTDPGTRITVRRAHQPAPR